MDRPVGPRQLTWHRHRTSGCSVGLKIALVVLTVLISLGAGPVPTLAAYTTHIENMRPAQAGEAVSIWHIPHPDDETIGMAGAMMADAREGRRNIVVFYTDGEASDVRLVLNGLIYCTIHGRYHDPEEEGYEPLDRAAFGRARLREAVAALALLGVAPDDVLALGLPDGHVSVDAALAVVETLDKLYPDAAHRTTALSDPHPDHRNLARALYTFLDAKRRGTSSDDNPSEPSMQPPDAVPSSSGGQQLALQLDVRFYSVYVYGRPTVKRGYSFASHAVPDLELKDRALAEFAVWAPQEGRFAIGMHSVPRLLVEASADQFEYTEPIPDTLTVRHRLRRQADLTVFHNKAAVHVGLANRLHLRLGITYAGDVRPPTILYAVPTMFNALRLRFGIAPTDWRFARARLSVAGVQLFNRVLLEYEPPSTSPGQGQLRVGWKFDL